MTHQQKMPDPIQQIKQQERKERNQEIASTFATELVKAVATGGMSLGTTLTQLSVKGAMKQGIKSATKQNLKKSATKIGKAAGQAALGTAQKLDNQDDDKMEMTEISLSMMTGGRL